VTDLFETDFAIRQIPPGCQHNYARLREMLPRMIQLSVSITSAISRRSRLPFSRSTSISPNSWWTGDPGERSATPRAAASAQRSARAEGSCKPRSDASLEVPIDKVGRYRLAMQFRMGAARVVERTKWSSPAEAIARKTGGGDGGEKTYTFTGTVQLIAGEAAVTFTTRPVASGANERQLPLELQPKLWLIGPLDSDLVYPHSHQRVFFRGDAPSSPAERRIYAREIVKGCRPGIS
jgi:hypothetical protein